MPTFCQYPYSDQEKAWTFPQASPREDLVISMVMSTTHRHSGLLPISTLLTIVSSTMQQSRGLDSSVPANNFLFSKLFVIDNRARKRSWYSHVLGENPQNSSLGSSFHGTCCSLDLLSLCALGSGLPDHAGGIASPICQSHISLFHDVYSGMEKYIM